MLPFEWFTHCMPADLIELATANIRKVISIEDVCGSFKVVRCHHVKCNIRLMFLSPLQRRFFTYLLICTLKIENRMMEFHETKLSVANCSAILNLVEFVRNMWPLTKYDDVLDVGLGCSRRKMRQVKKYADSSRPLRWYLLIGLPP